MNEVKLNTSIADKQIAEQILTLLSKIAKLEAQIKALEARIKTLEDN